MDSIIIFIVEVLRFLIDKFIFSIDYFFFVWFLGAIIWYYVKKILKKEKYQSLIPDWYKLKDTRRDTGLMLGLPPSGWTEGHEHQSKTIHLITITILVLIVDQFVWNLLFFWWHWIFDFTPGFRPDTEW